MRPQNHKASKKAHSRVSSQAVAEKDMSNSTTSSIASTDDSLETITFEQALDDCVVEILQVVRKKSTPQGREDLLASYASILESRYSFEEIQHRTSELFPVFLQGVKAGKTEKEMCLALKAISLTIITAPSDTAYDAMVPILKKAYTDSESHKVKAAAINTLGAVAAYGGASDFEIKELMDDLVDIIRSDGASIGAADVGEAVVAALQVWGFLATSIDDISDMVEEGIDAFLEQLDSSEVSVQVAAGEDIALVYEKSFEAQEAEDGSASDRDGKEGNPLDSGAVKRYEIYSQEYQLNQTLTRLAKESSKRISKKDRKDLRKNFADILNTIEHPHIGPKYSTALDEDGEILGSRMTIRISSLPPMTVDKWGVLHRIQVLKTLLGPGFVVHCAHNPAIDELL